jgi:hypothetical protein
VKIGAFGRFFVACAGEQEGKKLRACYTQWRLSTTTSYIPRHAYNFQCTYTHRLDGGMITNSCNFTST